MSAAGLIFTAGWASGINLYAVAFILGVAERVGATVVPEVFGNTLMLSVAGVLAIIEFFVDKFAFADSLWDSVHTFIRPVGAAFIGAALTGDVDGVEQAVAALSSGGLAFATHAGKATVRAAVNTSPEPFSNIVLSFFENTVVLSLMTLAFYNPVLAGVIAAVVLLFSLVAAGFLFSRAKRYVQFRRAKRHVAQGQQDERRERDVSDNS